MTGRIMGKITFAEYGASRDYPTFIGLHLGFQLAGGGLVTDGGRHTVNIDKKCRCEENERQQAITVETERLHKLLEAAKVNYVSELKGKPVEIEIESNMFKGFRILTEVL